MKTLKDLENCRCGTCLECYFKKELKQCAIEWIKELENERRDGTGQLPVEYKRGANPEVTHFEASAQLTAIIEWIKDFFNIEEDLK